MKKLALIVAAIFLVAVVNFAPTSAAQQIFLASNQVRSQRKADTSKFPAEVLRLVNVERAKVNLPPLRFANDLAASALIRAREIPIKFSHTRPNGSKCFTAMPQIGHILGENLAGGQTTPQKVVEAWMNSETHRANILNKNFRELGVVYYYQANSKFKHYWVQHFRG